MNDPPKLGSSPGAIMIPPPSEMPGMPQSMSSPGGIATTTQSNKILEPSLTAVVAQMTNLIGPGVKPGPMQKAYRYEEINRDQTLSHIPPPVPLKRGPAQFYPPRSKFYTLKEEDEATDEKSESPSADEGTSHLFKASSELVPPTSPTAKTEHLPMSYRLSNELQKYSGNLRTRKSSDDLLRDYQYQAPHNAAADLGPADSAVQMFWYKGHARRASHSDLQALKRACQSQERQLESQTPGRQSNSVSVPSTPTTSPKLQRKELVEKTVDSGSLVKSNQSNLQVSDKVKMENTANVELRSVSVTSEHSDTELKPQKHGVFKSLLGWATKSKVSHSNKDANVYAPTSF